MIKISLNEFELEILFENPKLKQELESLYIERFIY